MPQIHVRNLVKTFRVAQRLPGLWGNPMASPNGDVVAPLGSFGMSWSIVAVMPSGAVRWSTAIGIGSPMGPPRRTLAVRDDGSVIVAGDEVRALAEADGAVLWVYRPTTPLNIEGPLVVAKDGRILFKSWGIGTDLQVVSSAGAWQTSFPWFSFEYAVADTGITYLKPYTTHGGLVAVDPTGTTLWARWFSGWNSGPPAIGRDGTLYVSERPPVGLQGRYIAHTLRALDPVTGADLWIAPVYAANEFWRYPIAIGLNGQLVISEETTGRIVAFS